VLSRYVRLRRSTVSRSAARFDNALISLDQKT
jgi:hypothetical protein